MSERPFHKRRARAKGDVDYLRARLREAFIYNPDTGEFMNRVNRGVARAGEVAGFLQNNGYMQIVLDGRFYLIHRVAYLYVTGEYPPLVDHKNGNKTDNRFDNLRPATRAQNRANSSKVQNRFGLRGVRYYARGATKKWHAQIRSAGRNKSLGYFATKEEAASAYARAERELYGEFVRGSEQ